MNPYRNIRGISLIEILIAMVLGLLLITGMITVFASNKRSSQLNSAIADLQENARFAMDKLAGDIRMSGFKGCIDINRGKPMLLSQGLPTTDFHATAAMGSIIGSANLWTPAPPLGFEPANHNAIPGTHALTLQFGSPSTYDLTQAVSTSGVPNRAAPIVIDTTPGKNREEFNLETGDYAIISNCIGADIFRISGINQNATSTSIEHKAPFNDSGLLSFDYKNDSHTKFMRFVSNVYYVGDSGLVNEHGDQINSLFQQSLPYGDPTLNPPVELIQGVDNLRVSFGVRTNPQSLSYVLATDPKYDPRLVESIRIGLLMSSYDRISQSDDTNTYVLAGQAINATSDSSSNASGGYPKDKRYRLAFNTTVKIRNRRN